MTLFNGVRYLLFYFNLYYSARASVTFHASLLCIFLYLCVCLGFVCIYICRNYKSRKGICGDILWLFVESQQLMHGSCEHTNLCHVETSQEGWKESVRIGQISDFPRQAKRNSLNLHLYYQQGIPRGHFVCELEFYEMCRLCQQYIQHARLPRLPRVHERERLKCSLCALLALSPT